MNLLKGGLHSQQCSFRSTYCGKGNCETFAMQVFPISNVASPGTPTIGTVINLGAGSNLQTIAADRTSNIWLASTNVTDTGVINSVFVIAKDTNTVTTVDGLAFASGASGLNGVLLHHC